MNFIFPRLLDKIITRSIRFLATTRLHIFSSCGLFTVWVNFVSHVHMNTCRTPSAADRNLNAVRLMWGGGSGSAPSGFFKPPPYFCALILTSLPAPGSLPFRALSPRTSDRFSLFSFSCFANIANINYIITEYRQIGVPFFLVNFFSRSEDNFSPAIVRALFAHLTHLDFFSDALRAVFTHIAAHTSCQCNTSPMWFNAGGRIRC